MVTHFPYKYKPRSENNESLLFKMNNSFLVKFFDRKNVHSQEIETYCVITIILVWWFLIY